MLSSLASVFDPLGLITSLHLLSKLIFQQAGRLKIPWDGDIPNDLANSWNEWVISMTDIRTFTTLRCVMPGDFVDAYCEMHCFRGAIQYAYGACIYIRCVNRAGHMHTSLVYSKCAPNDPSPLLDWNCKLLYCLLRLESSVRSALSMDVNPSGFFSDSQIMLAYIKNKSRRFHIYVANRVATIRDLPTPEQWHHIPSKENPADLISKGVRLNSIDAQFWQDGPYFLHCHTNSWKHPGANNDIPDDDIELKRSDIILHITNIVHPINMICNHYSSWDKIRRIVAYLVRLRTH